ncbi:MAG: hypothetical protein KAT05_06275 [Spirochaetes bacterium]|nr:hypothetical protein [Spirochaetota bacterium]
MMIDYIREILLQHREGITVERLEDILLKKNINESITDIINQSDVFTLQNGIVFLKSSLIKYKEDFLKEFDDYLQGKIRDKELRNNMITNFIVFIPDVLFIKWLNIKLERKLMIFDLLFSMIIKPKILKNKLKIYFNNLIEFYSILVIYSILLSKNYENNSSVLFSKIKKIELYEEILKKHLFYLLSMPDVVKTKLNSFEHELNITEIKLHTILKKTFHSITQYSPKLLKRIVSNEIKDFNFFLLLTRFEYKTFYEWLTTLIEEKVKPNHNLFKDLGLN